MKYVDLNFAIPRCGIKEPNTIVVMRKRLQLTKYNITFKLKSLFKILC